MDNRLKRYGTLLAGAFICVAAMQVFIVPLGLYNGGTVGVSQLLRSLILEMWKRDLGIDLAGPINLLINIPLMIMAYKTLSKDFVIRTAFVVVAQTIFISFIQIKEPLIADTLTSCIVGGVIAGMGCGMILWAGGSGAGFDILGVWLAKNKLHVGVGTLTAIMNGCVYLLCAILYSFPIAVYSIIYAAICSMTINKIHLQNINCSVMIITEKKEIHTVIMDKIRRGVTYWSASGGYVKDNKYVYYTIVSKNEERKLRKLILEIDNNAFIVVSENKQIYGNYDRRIN